MLADIQPDLENIAHRNAVFLDNSTEDTLAIRRNAHSEIRYLFLCILRKAEVFQSRCVQTLKVEIWFCPVYKPDVEGLGGFEQSKAQPWPR